MVLPDAAGFAVRDDRARRIAGGRRPAAQRHADRQFARRLFTPPIWRRSTAGRAVLLNPAVVPQRDLSAYLGEQPLWHGGGSIVVEPHHLDELRALGVASITRPERYYLMAATGDEVLDYREMLAHYPGARTTLIEGQRPRDQRVRAICRRRAGLLRRRRRRAARAARGRVQVADKPGVPAARRGLPRIRFMPPARAYARRGSTTTNTLPCRARSDRSPKPGSGAPADAQSEREY